MELHIWHWLAFGGFVLVLLTLDLFVFHRHAHAPSLRESAGWTAFWAGLALAFNGLIWWWQGFNPALDFFTGYVVEWSLSMDNVFVFAVIFRFFHVPLQYQYRVLFWGILGAIILRLTFILIGSSLLHRFDWIMVIFGGFLIFTAIKLAVQSDTEVHPDRNFLLRLARRWLPITRGGHDQYGQAFFARENGRLCFTPLFLLLLVVESTDVLFAVDSVPVIFGITHDAFIVFTSNIFAILGLRALYFLLAGAMTLFRYLHFGLSGILGFIGVMMIADFCFAPPQGHVLPTPVKLAVIAVVLAVSIVFSIAASRREGNVAAPTTGVPDESPPASD
jgi:tellurite resistance protein TerC